MYWVGNEAAIFIWQEWMGWLRMGKSMKCRILLLPGVLLLLGGCATKTPTTATAGAGQTGMVRGPDGTLYLAKDAPKGSQAVSAPPVVAAAAPKPSFRDRMLARREAMLADPGKRALAGLLLGAAAGMNAYSQAMAAAPVPQYSYQPVIVDYNAGPTPTSRYAAGRSAGGIYSQSGTYSQSGNFLYGPDGIHQRIGNFWYHPDGTTTQKIGNTLYNSDGTSVNRVGNFWYGSDGSTTHKVGNFYYHSDGTTTQRIGNTLYRN